MIRTFLNVSVATALLASSFSAAAAPYSFASDYQAPAGATATINFQVPLGAVPQKARKATYGLTLGYGQRMDSVTDSGRIATRQTKLADFRFTGAFKLQRWASCFSWGSPLRPASPAKALSSLADRANWEPCRHCI